MEWTCANTEERLSDVLDRALIAEEQSAFSAHAAHCARCAEVVALVAGLAARMHAMAPVSEPSGLQERILAATLGPRRRSAGAESWLDWASAFWRPRFAMGVASVAATGLILLHLAAPGLRRLRPGDVNPASLLRDGNRQAHLSYARGVKFVNDLRVVYEIHSMFASQPAPSALPAAEPPSAPKRQAPAPGSREKSESAPSPENRQRDPAALALLRNGDFAAYFPSGGPRRIQ